MELLTSIRRRQRVFAALTYNFSSLAMSLGLKFDRERFWGPFQVLLTYCICHTESSSKSGISFTDGIGLVYKSSAGEAFGWGQKGKAPTERSFYDARCKAHKLGEDYFWRQIQEVLPSTSSGTESRFGGFRFLHGDGMQFHVPRNSETIKEFGVQHNGPCNSTHYPQGKLALLIEGGSGRLVDYKILRCKDKKQAQKSSLPFEERSAIDHFVANMDSKDCIVWDCGGSSMALFHHMIQAKKHFIMAVGKNLNLVKQAIANKKKDQIIDYTIPPSIRTSGIPHNQRTIRLRILAVKGAKGQRKYVVTNILDELDRSEIRRVYRQRWAVETLFRHAKEYLGARILRSQKLWGIKQEILAIMAILHMVAHTQDMITKNENKVSTSLCCLRKGFRRPRLFPTLDLIKEFLIEVAPKRGRGEIPRSTAIAWINTMYRPYIVEPGRSAERISKLPFGLFRPKRDSHTQRRAKTKKTKAA